MLPSQLVTRGWIQGENAQNGMGRGVGAFSPDAVAWCALGALYAGLDGEEYTAVRAAVDRLVWELSFMPWKIFGEANVITNWNDAPGRTQGEVVKLLETAERECGLGVNS